jgi:CheY-like chemotaxis protein
MPRMNGYEFRPEQLKDPSLAAIPIIVVSATPNDADLSALHATAVVAKPITVPALLKLIGQLFALEHLTTPERDSPPPSLSLPRPIIKR